MRDIDFDELDKAVNNYLGGEVSQPQKPQKTDEKKEIEKPAPRKMVFSRRQIVDAGNFHRGVKTEVKYQDLPENPKVADEPDFAKYLRVSEEDGLREISGRSTPTVGEFENFTIISNKELSTIEKAENLEVAAIKNANKYQEKRNTLDESLAPKTIEYQAPILEQIEVLPDEVAGEFSAKVEENLEISEKAEKENASFYRSRNSVVVPPRAGVYKLEEDAEINVFSGKGDLESSSQVEEILAEKSEASNQENGESQSEEFDKISVSVKKSPILTEEMVAGKAEEKTAVKIGINFSDEETMESGEFSRIDDAVEDIISGGKSENVAAEGVDARVGFVQAPSRVLGEEKVEASSQGLTEKSQENIENSFDKIQISTQSSSKKEEKIITQPTLTQEIKEVKTPFVANPKIDKRPLGAANNQMVSSFEMRKNFAKRKQEIRRAKMENPAPQTPILAREEFQSPSVHKKKKSGWGVVLAILLVTLLVSAGVGLAVYYFSLNN